MTYKKIKNSKDININDYIYISKYKRIGIVANNITNYHREGGTPGAYALINFIDPGVHDPRETYQRGGLFEIKKLIKLDTYILNTKGIKAAKVLFEELDGQKTP